MRFKRLKEVVCVYGGDVWIHWGRREKPWMGVWLPKADEAGDWELSFTL